MGWPGRLRDRSTGPLNHARRRFRMTLPPSPPGPAAVPARGADAAGPDPSMEEILASIRRILNEDEPAGATGEASGEESPSDDDVLVLDRSMLVSAPGLDAAALEAERSAAVQPAAVPVDEPEAAGPAAVEPEAHRPAADEPEAMHGEAHQPETRQLEVCPRGGCPGRGSPRCQRTGRNPCRDHGRTRRRTRVPNIDAV